MTSQAFRLKLTRVNQLKLKVNARIPAVITAQSPIVLDKTNGNYSFSLDMNAIDDMIGNSFATAAQGATADTAVQPGDLGDLAVKDKISVPGDMTVSGTPDGSKFLRDDGSWEAIPGGGDVLAANHLTDVNVVAAGTGAVARTAASKFGDFVSVKDFGAVGDGSIDDTAALQAAIDALPAPSDANNLDCGPILLFPTGTYKISDELVLNKKCELRGDGNARIVGDVSGAAHKTAFYLGDTTYLLPENSAQGHGVIKLTNLNMGAITGHDYAILGHGYRHVEIAHCTVSGGAVASVRLLQSWNASKILHNLFQGGGSVGLLIDDQSNAALVLGNRFNGYNWLADKGIGLSIRASQGVWVKHNDFEYCRTQIYAVASTAGFQCDNLVIDENWIEGAMGGSVFFDNSQGGFSGFSFCKNSVYGDPNGDVYLGVSGGTGAFAGGVIQGNRFNSPSTLLFPSSASKYQDVIIEGNTPSSMNGRSSFIASLSGDQTGIVASTYTKLNFVASKNRRGRFASNAWTPEAGLVSLEASALVSEGVTTGDLIVVAIYKNGSVLYKQDFVMPASFAQNVCVRGADEANGTDVYTAYIYAGGSGTKTVSSNSANTWFRGQMVV